VSSDKTTGHPGAGKLEATLRSRFGEGLVSVRLLNGNEVHAKIRNKESLPDMCVYVHDELKGALATVVCSDDRRINDCFSLRYVFGIPGGEGLLIVIEALTRGEEPSFPSVALRLPSATLYEREVRDMFGVVPEGHPDGRPMVVHDEWSSEIHPLRKDFEMRTKVARDVRRPYEFLKVEGEGVSEIPVGPVHAGIIEPGHFRFSTLGDMIVNLETRLYYTHRGVEKLAESMDLEKVLLISERISGDEAVANSTAYCQAIEKAAGVTPPPRALLTRAVCAEMERIYNHLGTLAGLSTDVGFAYGAARLNLLKERMMRLNEEVSGSRLLFGVNRLGGVGVDLNEEKPGRVLGAVGAMLADFTRVVSMLKGDSSVMDRLRGTGVISPALVLEIGAVGVAARSSGLDIDTRRDHPYGAYRSLRIDPHHDTPRHAIQYEVEMTKKRGDVLARFETRIEEVTNSVEIVKEALQRLGGDSELVVPVPRESLEPHSHALGYAESHRGQTVHWVTIGEDRNSLLRYKVRTASFCNWPAIEAAVLNDIVADFPLVNKSLDLSYAGNDL